MASGKRVDSIRVPPPSPWCGSGLTRHVLSLTVAGGSGIFRPTSTIRRTPIMKPATIVGIVLIALGAAALVYKGFNYTSEETVLQIGSVKATAETEKSVS